MQGRFEFDRYEHPIREGTMPNKDTDTKRRNPYEGHQTRYGDSTQADDISQEEAPQETLFERGTVNPVGRPGKR